MSTVDIKIKNLKKKLFKPDEPDEDGTYERYPHLKPPPEKDKMVARNNPQTKPGASKRVPFTVTYSNMCLYLTCQRKYKYRIIDKLLPIGWDPEPLRFGARFHDILEFHHQGKPEEAIIKLLDSRYPDMEGSDAQKVEYSKLLAMYYAYAKTHPREKERFKVLETEKKFENFIVNPSAKRSKPWCGRSRSYKMSGKIDAVCADIDGHFIMEHKTTSRLDPAYMEKVIRFDFQIKNYIHYLSEELGIKIRRVLYNVVQKPSIRLKKNESVEAFCKRIEEWYDNRPGAMWRQEIQFTDEDIIQARKNVWHILHHMKVDMNHTKYGQFWPQNPTACEKWGRFCEYYDICSSNDSPIVIKNNFQKVEPNSELRDENGPEEIF